MNIKLFNKKYWIRRFGEQSYVRGIVVNDHTDFVASLHVHPSGTDQQQALPEGERRIKKLEGHGTCKLVVADPLQGQKGDLIYYFGEWYECINAQPWDHTLLSHINYLFVLVPPDGASSVDLEDPPGEDPNYYASRGECCEI